MQTANPTFSCASCHRAHDWKPEYVGKVARCSCGQVMKVPALRLPEAAPEPTPHVPAPPRPANSIAPFGPIPEADDSLDADVEAELAATGAYGDEDLAKPDPFRDHTAPLILIAIGFLLLLGQVGHSVQSGATLAFTLIGTLVALTIQLALMLGGIFLAARFAGLSFGPLNLALLKLLAIYLAPSTLGTLVTQFLGGDIAVACIGWAITITLYWTLLSYLFRLDGAQTMTCVATIAGVRFAANVFVIGLILGAVSLSAPSLDEMPADGETLAAEEAAWMAMDEE